jgi:hypothetical protein
VELSRTRELLQRYFVNGICWNYSAIDLCYRVSLRRIKKIVKMTVITKPISGKKPDKLDVPLVENEQVEHLVSVQQVLSRKDFLVGTPVFVGIFQWMKAEISVQFFM